MPVVTVEPAQIQSSDTVKHYPLGFIVVGFAVGAAALWSLNSAVLGFFHDDGIYAVVAKSLAQGEGYRITSLPLFPAQTKYPFLYSFLLSWLWTLNPEFPYNIALLKALNVGFLVGIFFLSCYFYGRQTGRWQWDTLLYGSIVCCSPAVFSFTDFAVSDLLFMFLTLGALCIFCAPVERPTLWRQGVVGAVVLALAYLTKPAGLPLAAAAGLHLGLHGRYRELGVFSILFMAFISPWVLWTWIQRDGPLGLLFEYYLAHDRQYVAFISIWHDPRQAIEILWSNLRYFLGSVDLIFVLGLVPGLWIAVYGIIAVGAWQSQGKKNRFLWLFVALYLGLILSWPFHPMRYTLPLIPVLTLFFFNGSWRLNRLYLELRGRTHGKKWLLGQIAWLPLGLVTILVGVWLSAYLFAKKSDTFRGPYGAHLPFSWEGFAETFKWVQQNTDKNALLATAYDPMYYLYTGRKAIRPALHKPETYFYPYGNPTPAVGSAAQIRAELKALGVRYLIIDPLDSYAEKNAQLKLLEAIVESDSATARLVFESRDSKHKVYTLSD